VVVSTARFQKGVLRRAGASFDYSLDRGELIYCLLDTYYSVFAILICIMIVVVLLKIREVVFKNGLNNIPASGFVDWYMGVHTMFKQERQEEKPF